MSVIRLGVLIISCFPNASYFFFGQAGMESVAMVGFTGKVHQFKTDQMLSIRGKSKLNSFDIQKLAFVMEEATVEVVSDYPFKVSIWRS